MHQWLVARSVACAFRTRDIRLDGVGGGAGSRISTAEENQVPKMTKENTQGEVPQEAAQARSSNDDVPKCPSCGSAKYHRTERTALERALQRPPMARCERCGKRFPYVTHPDEPKRFKNRRQEDSAESRGASRRCRLLEPGIRPLSAIVAAPTIAVLGVPPRNASCSVPRWHVAVIAGSASPSLRDSVFKWPLRVSRAESPKPPES